MADSNAWLKDLAKSGLTEDDARQLRITYLTAAQTKATDNSFAEVPSLRINYMDPFNPTKPLAPRPKWPAFFRIRYLEDVKTKDGKIQRYTQPPASGVCAYFPTTMPWKEIAENPDHDIIITEGEKKAAAGCKAGFPTIGLGGVSSFSNAAIGITFLLELEKISWVKRRVYIIFDSDILTKPNVCTAMNTFAKCMEERGAIPMYVLLPSSGDNKVGLDDYLLAHTPTQLQHLIDSTRMSLTVAEPLWAMNEETIYVQTPGMLVRGSQGELMSERDFKTAFGNVLAYDQTVNPATGNLKFTKVDLPSLWLKWPLRRTARKVAFSPGDPMGLMCDADGSVVYNSWTGWGVPSIKGDVKPFLKLVDSMFKLMKPHEKAWFMQWLAYPIKNPGAKLKSAVLVYSRHQGTGKSFLADIVSGIYGAHAGAVTNSELESQFNRWAKDKQFVVANEVLGGDNRTHANTLKNLVTESTLSINDKNVPTYIIANRTQFYLTTNHTDGVYMTKYDRRYFVLETGEPESDEFYEEVDKWFRDPQKRGLSALRYYLEHSVDCSLYKPQAKPPVTRAKESVVEATMSTVETWCSALADDPDNVLFLGSRPITCDLVTAKELWMIYEAANNMTHGGKTTVATLGKHLGHAGLTKANGGANILVTGAVPPKAVYWIVRNAAKWKKASHAECAAHIKKHMPAGLAARY